MLTIDPALFQPDAILDDTKALNEWILNEVAKGSDMWAIPPSDVRALRESGRGLFPIQKNDTEAFDIEIEGPSGPITARIVSPLNCAPKGTYLHIHGGGWQVGSIYGMDERLREIAERCSLTCISIDYRLAPEHPYPAGPDDCEAAACWLLSGDHDYNTDFTVIGGESAGAHLSVMTLLRLRERGISKSFDAAVLTCGVYDLGHTASTKNWGSQKLVLNTRDMKMFTAGFLQGGEDRRSGHISPLFARLHDLPAAYFTIGTADLLLDDTLQMAMRWHAANGNAQLEIAPGGCHVFQSFRDLEITKCNNCNVDDFVNSTREAITREAFSKDQ